MRTQDIGIGKYYRFRNNEYCYAKAIKILRPRVNNLDKTSEEKTLKCVVVKCEWSQDKNPVFGLIKYFRPCDLVKI